MFMELENLSVVNHAENSTFLAHFVPDIFFHQVRLFQTCADERPRKNSFFFFFFFFEREREERDDNVQ